jgi:D-alanyl-D-alanine carboxypeptidase
MYVSGKPERERRPRIAASPPTDSRSLRRRIVSAASALTAAVMLLGGCAATSASAPVASPSVASTPNSATGSKAGCVADPAAVVTAKLPRAASGPVSSALASSLASDVAGAMKQIAATGAVVSVQTPKGTWTKAFGVADPATGDPMTTDVYQRLGSITKTFTGTLILQLVDEGTIRLSDPIDRYVSGIPNGSTVTIKTLLDMTSGLASYTLDPNWQKVYFAQPDKV